MKSRFQHERNTNAQGIGEPALPKTKKNKKKQKTIKGNLLKAEQFVMFWKKDIPTLLYCCKDRQQQFVKTKAA